MNDYKIVHDSVHGSIRAEGFALQLLEAPELQRLHSIHQLGLAYLVYPGANHTRFEHSLGTFAVAKRLSGALRLSEGEAATVQAAALLHDVGHLPYSHTLEFILHDRFGMDHVEISRRLIRGEESVVSEAEKVALGKCPSIAETLERFDIDPKEVASLLEGKGGDPSGQRRLPRHAGQAHFNSRRYLPQMVSGPVDADQLDYLKRDAHYTGVAYGVIDLDRLMETIQVFNGDLVVEKGGLSAIEGMLVARALMFSAVYFHKTVRISELMLAKAVEQLGRDEVGRIHSMTDATLLSHLVSKGGYYQEIAALIKYRRLFKKAYAVPIEDIDRDGWDEIDAMGAVKRRRSLEQEIAQRAGVDPGHVVIDVPSRELSVSEPRLSLTDARILDKGKVRLLSRMSSIAASLQVRRAHEWAVMVACPAANREVVAKAAAKVLGS
ncbi:MAG: HD domain-containing protein [Candidatus Thermoplasmatota archaeon]|nr:HD domain-containing protein [Candidatus Thermoplasmatota archaeon]